jgi:hypothetical protein
MFPLISPIDIVGINCTCFLWSHQVILSVSIIHVSFDLTKWYCQYQLYMFPLSHQLILSGLIGHVSFDLTKWYCKLQLILTISLGEIKGYMYYWYWQYPLLRSKETCTIDTDNITWWDQRKHIQLILTISLGEIKGKMYNWF